MSRCFAVALAVAVLVAGSAYGATVSVPSAWTSSGFWVDSGVSVTRGDSIHVTANGVLSTIDGVWCGPEGYPSSVLSWFDQWLNPNSLGNGSPDPAAGGVPPVTDHYYALIGYIGQQPLPLSLYGNCSREDRLLFVSRMVLLGSNVTVKAPSSGKLWLGINTDAYAGNLTNDKGQLTVTVDDIPHNAEIRAAVDDFQWIWLNPGVLSGDGTSDPSYLGTYQSLSVPCSYPISLKDGINTILIRATNAGSWTTGNPAGFIARILYDNDTLSCTNASWEYSLDENPTVSGNWQSPSTELYSWDNTAGWPWPTTDAIRAAFSGSDAKWIWNTSLQQPSLIWFRTQVYVPTYDADNGHYYAVVPVEGGIDWQSAAIKAQNMQYKGMIGHMATITSPSESNFIQQNFQAEGYWLGGYQISKDNEPSGNWAWITGEDWDYTNWRSDQPDNTVNTEDRLQLLGPNGAWNDNTSETKQPGFVVEFDSLANVSSPVYNPANGHYYQMVSTPRGTEWYGAEAAAERTVFNGAPGHLAAVTDPSELEFIASRFPGADGFWLGGYQPAVGTANATTGWRWVTGEPMTYTAWMTGCPTAATGEDDNWANGIALRLPDGKWQDDLTGKARPGYIVEYDGWRPGPVLNPSNGHYYQVISAPGGIDWYDAEAEAETITCCGAQGHLVTLTSAEENNFVSALAPISSGFWIGGYQPDNISEPAGGWQWTNGESWTYTNWDQYEPNDTYGFEDGAELRLNGKWNDRQRTDASVSGYIVEFEPEPVFVDNFDDNIMNPLMWKSEAGTGTTISEASGKLQITYSSKVPGPEYDAAYKSVRQIRGDFDMQVDYQLLNWSIGNGVRVGLIPTWWDVERGSLGLNEIYAANSYSSPVFTLNTTDTSGKLRIKRSGSVISSYFLNQGEWKLIQSHDFGENGLIDLPWFALSAWTHDYAFAGTVVTVAFDNFVLRQGELFPALSNSASIGDVRKLQDGCVVTINNAAVTAATRQIAGAAFIEDEQRCSGIKLITTQTLNIGQRVSLTGTLRRTNGEWQIDTPSISLIEAGLPIEPLGMTTKCLANDPAENLQYQGVNTTGLLVRTYGKVTGVVSEDRIAYIDDGSGRTDGLSSFTGLRVRVPAGAELPTEGDRVIVTGISRVEKKTLASDAYVNGTLRLKGSVIYVPSLWPRTTNDLITLD